MRTIDIARPREVFPMWRRAQLEVERNARETLISPSLLRTTGLMRPELAERAIGAADRAAGRRGRRREPCRDALGELRPHQAGRPQQGR